MNKALLFLAAFVLISCASTEWITRSEDSGVIVKSSWQELSSPSETGATMRLNIWVENTGNSPVEYDLGVEFFLQGKMLESSPVERNCAKPGIVYRGKINGTYYEPVGITSEQISDSLITVEFVPLDVQVVGECVK